MTHVDSTSVQSLLQVGGHDANASPEIDSAKNIDIHSSSSDPSPTGAPVPISRTDSVSTKPVPVPRRKSVKEDSGESRGNVGHKETVTDKAGSLGRIPPKLPPRDDNIQPETPHPPEKVHAMVDHKTPPELPKRPCSTEQNIETTLSNAPAIPARTDLVTTSVNSDDSFPIPPPRKGRKKVIQNMIN